MIHLPFSCCQNKLQAVTFVEPSSVDLSLSVNILSRTFIVGMFVMTFRFLCSQFQQIGHLARGYYAHRCGSNEVFRKSLWFSTSFP